MTTFSHSQQSIRNLNEGQNKNLEYVLAFVDVLPVLQML